MLENGSHWTITSTPGEERVWIETFDGSIRVLRSELPDLIYALQRVKEEQANG